LNGYAGSAGLSPNHSQKSKTRARDCGGASPVAMSMIDLAKLIGSLGRLGWVIGWLPGLANQSQSFLTGRSDSIHTRPFHHTYLNWCAIPN
jgi:hypothetical protein